MKLDSYYLNGGSSIEETELQIHTAFASHKRSHKNNEPAQAFGSSDFKNKKYDSIKAGLSKMNDLNMLVGSSNHKDSNDITAAALFRSRQGGKTNRETWIDKLKKKNSP